MQLRQSKNNLRNSSVVAQPEQFVTVEIQNHHMMKKYRHYRESIIKEIKVTHDRVEETLNKCVGPSKSKFNYRSTSKNILGVTVRRLKESQKTILQVEKEYSFSPQVNKKLQQISNISRYFHQACQPREKPKKVVDLTDVPYTLPVVDTEHLISPSLRSKDQLQEEQTMVHEWRQTVKLGRDYVKLVKERNPVKYKLKTSKFNTVRDQDKQNSEMPRKSLKSLRDVYFSPIKQERKSTPAECNNLQLLVCQKKLNKASLTYNGCIEQQQARRLQQFIEGGASKQINEYTEHISIPQFLKSKQKFKTLATIYNHVKDKAILQSKESPIASFHTPSMLSVIYYVENAHNMTQNQKKLLRVKLKFSD